jgi:primosomal protein N' (replication factor Y)
LGRRQVNGVVWGAGSENVDESKIKDVLDRLSTPFMSDVSRAFVDWVAAYTVSSPGAVLKMTMSVPAALEEPKPDMVYGLNPAPPNFKMTPARQRVIEVLENGEPPRAAADLAREAVVGTSVVSGLVKAGGLLSLAVTPTIKMARPDGNHPGLDLSEVQAQAGATLAGDVAKGGFAASLLDGVPGSGKTEVYFEAVAEALKQGRQVLVLLPEIALSAPCRVAFGFEPGPASRYLARRCRGTGVCSRRSPFGLVFTL